MKLAVITILLCFFVTSLAGPYACAGTEALRLPAPGEMVHLSPAFNPPVLKGLKVHPQNPFRFDFILDSGDSGDKRSDAPRQMSPDLKAESTRLIKYFLAAITIPEKDLWVNLSPYEKDRIVPEAFGLTEMGRDLLAQDYLLKQITASLIYPEDETGRQFWQRVYAEAARRYGTTDVPVDTFNKVWIMPDKAVVYENAKAGTAYVAESRFKVMLEQDYLALEKHEGIQSATAQVQGTSQLGSEIVREVVIPELTREVNENRNFIQLRQVYNSLILATWYKKKIRDSILSQVYADQNKVSGVNIDDPDEKEKIYQRYLQAFEKGVFNYIKEEKDVISEEPMPRKYFSGGITTVTLGADIEIKEADRAMLSAVGLDTGRLMSVRAMAVNSGLTKPAVRNGQRSKETPKAVSSADQAMQGEGHKDASSQPEGVPDMDRAREEMVQIKAMVRTERTGFVRSSRFAGIDFHGSRLDPDHERSVWRKEYFGSPDEFYLPDYHNRPNIYDEPGSQEVDLREPSVRSMLEEKDFLMLWPIIQQALHPRFRRASNPEHGAKIDDGGDAVIFSHRSDPSRSYKVFKFRGYVDSANKNITNGNEELMFLTYLNNKNVTGVPRIVDWGIRPEVGDVWLELEGIAEAQGILDKRSKLSGIWQGLSLAQRLDAIVQAAHVLSVAHQLGISHNEVKPQNLLINPQGELLVIDWNGATLFGEAVGTKTRDFGVPEARTQERSDVYQLGKTILISILGVIPRSIFSMLDRKEGEAIVDDLIKKKVLDAFPSDMVFLRPKGAGTVSMPSELQKDELSAIRELLQQPSLLGLNFKNKEVASLVDLCKLMISEDPNKRPSMQASADHLRAIAQRIADPGANQQGPIVNMLMGKIPFISRINTIMLKAVDRVKAAVGQDSAMSVNAVDKSGSSARREARDRVRAFRLWAEEHRGQTVKDSRIELAQRFGVSVTTVRKIIIKYNIITDSDRFKAERKLVEWAELHRGQTVPETLQELADKFGLPRTTVQLIVKAYEIITAGNKSEAIKALMAWAEPRCGGHVAETLQSLADRFGLSSDTVGELLYNKYGIVTAGLTGERLMKRIAILLEGADKMLLLRIQKRLSEKGYTVLAVVRGIKAMREELKAQPRINFVISEGEVDKETLVQRRFINLGDFLDKNESLNGRREAFFNKVDAVAQEDRAQVSDIDGGIDLTAAQIDLQARELGGSIQFRLDPAMLQQFKDAPGFVPVVVNIQPMSDLDLWMGVKDVPAQ